jgi:hypothetical protein
MFLMFITFLVLIGFVVLVTLLVFGYVLGVHCVLTSAHVANDCWLSITINIHHVASACHIHGACDVAIGAYNVDFPPFMASNTPTLALSYKLKLHWSQNVVCCLQFQ